MEHNIKISTVEALLIIQLLRENEFSNKTDKIMARSLKEMIIGKVAAELKNDKTITTKNKKQQQKNNKKTTRK